jgi:methyl-accepting chemotaxis protein
MQNHTEQKQGAELLDTLRTAEAALERITAGNLADSAGAGDTSILKAIEDMRRQLTRLIGEVTVNVKQLSHSAGEMTDLAAATFKRTKIVNERSEHVVRATTEMNLNMNTIASAAEELSVNMSTVSQRTNASSENLVNVTQSVGQMTSTIDEIAHSSEQAREIVSQAVDSVKRTTEIMAQLNKAASGINYVTASISGISDQTKLLALNATIEAARAGEAGSRFSVVANEVKALAGETGKATRDIQEKVEAMQSATTIALREIKHINEVMEQVNNAVSSIASAVEEQSSATREIAVNIAQAADGIKEMDRAVMEANIAVQEVTTNISQAARLSGEVAEEIAGVSGDNTALRNDATLLYTGAMEVSSHTADTEALLRSFKLPAGAVKDQDKNLLFRFSEVYSVKVADLDKQHQGIFEYINRIHAAIKRRASNDELAPIIRDMADFTARHFANEERLMQSVRYPDLESHKPIHVKLIADLTTVLKRLERNEEVNLIELMVFLKNWLVSHIQGTDKKYSDAMNRAGVR